MTYAFIDASNIIYGAREEGWHIDLKKLLIYLKNKFSAIKFFFYYGKDSNNEKKEMFLQKLIKFGYTLRVKEIKRFGTRIKANCDVDMTMDILILQKEYQRAIILTGDGDFTPLFSYMRKIKKKEILIISSPKRTARELRIFAGAKHIDFGSLRYLLEYKKRGRP